MQSSAGNFPIYMHMRSASLLSWRCHAPLPLRGIQQLRPLLSRNIQGDSGKERSEWKQTLMLAIPTAFDLVATVLMNVGLLSVTASVYQMMRGAEMLFAALFAVVFLRRTLNRFHILGILCCVVHTSSTMNAWLNIEHRMLGSLFALNVFSSHATAAPSLSRH